MSRLTRRHVTAVLTALCLSASPGAGLTQSGVPVDLDGFVLRATGPHLTKQMVEAVADSGPVRKLDPSGFPEAGAFSLRQVVTALCGRASTDYLDLFKTKNGLTDKDLDRPAGDTVYDVEFPSCLYVAAFATPRRYVARPGDSYATIKERFTGSQGTPETAARFFDLPVGKVRSGKLQAGDVLNIPYMTLATPLPKMADTASAFELAPGHFVEDYVTKPAVAVGRLVTYVGAGGVSATPEIPKECGTLPVTPFDGGLVADTFQWVQQRASQLNQRTPNNVDVMIADNGFFGAKHRAAGGYDFREPEFSARYFETAGSSGKHLGPLFGSPPEEIYPVNFQNDLEPSGPLSGHGTHVTGLVLGGPGFLPYRKAVYGNQGVGWLKISQFNVGRGSDVLLANSDRELSIRLLLLTGSRIVNLSLSYDGSASGIANSFAFMDESAGATSAGRHLYVVAAGNDTRSNVADYYPAARGGIASSNSVITVAALAPDGRLTEFTNIGADGVDVAAPGCNLESWTDNIGPPVMLSGTSQAAPLVSFQATLIRALTGAEAPALKARILASGDLLEPGDQDFVSSHAKINIVKSLFVFDDYVRFGPKDNERVVLGRVLKVGGAVCRKDNLSVGLKALAAVRREKGAAFIYRRPGATQRLAECAAKPPGPDDVVVVEPLFEVAPGFPASPETLLPENQRLLTIPAHQVSDLVMRMIDAN